MRGNVVVEINKNSMEAVVTINSNNSMEITGEVIRAALEKEGVTTGIDEAALKSLPKNAQYGMGYTVAKGKKPIKGESGYYEFLVSDHSQVTKGRLLAKYHPAGRGSLGCTVFGTVIAPSPAVEEPELSLLNVERRDNGFYATEDGILSQRGYYLEVLRQVEMNRDITSMHGLVDIGGDLHVHGDIRDGAKVQATGNIVVDGVIEGAFVSAGKEMIVKQGVHGKGSAVLKAEKITAAFLEEASASAEELIHVGHMFNSDVFCKDTILADGNKGLIVGGTVTAGHCIEANTIGNAFGVGSSLILKTVDPFHPVEKCVIVHGEMYPSTYLQFDDTKAENVSAEQKEFHCTSAGILPYEIGKFIKPISEVVAPPKKEVPKPLVMIVDDDPVVLKKEYSDLSEKYTVAALAKPTDVLMFLNKKIPDLMLLDYMMPEMNGSELLSRIRKKEGCKAIPAFFLTGVSDKAVVVQCLSMYPQGYLLKPMSKEELLKVVDDFFRENAK